MNYPLHDLNDKDFAELANMICSQILGMGIIAFHNVSRNICQAHNLQHIITLIDTDAPTDENHQPIHFNKGETVLELNDKDEKGLLFEKKF